MACAPLLILGNAHGGAELRTDGHGYTLDIQEVPMKVQVAQWGNSHAVRLPKAVLDQLGLGAGSQLELTVDGDEVRLRRVRKAARDLLSEMLSEMERLGIESEPDMLDWGPDRGSEIIDDEYSRGDIKT